MTLTDQQAAQIKKQLLPQIAQLPQEQQTEAKAYIESMTNNELEEFLIYWSYSNFYFYINNTYLVLILIFYLFVKNLLNSCQLCFNIFYFFICF